MCGTVHTVKQMGLDTKFQEAANVVKNMKIDCDITKDDHSKAKKDHKKKNDNPPHTALITVITGLEKAWHMCEEVRAIIEVIGTQPPALCEPCVQ